MSSWAYKRKFIYAGAFFLLIFLAVFIPLYYLFYQKPTCFDGRQNGDEKGIDCGGSCSRLCQNDSVDPIISWARTFKVSDGVYNSAAYIQNVNLDAGVSYAPYIFKIYDKDGGVLYQRTGVTFIPPGKTFAVFESGIELADKIPARTTFEFTDSLKWIKSGFKEPKLNIKDKILSGLNYSPKLEATLENPTTRAVEKVELVSIVYDSSGNAAGASRTFVDRINPKSSQDIVFTWPEPFNAKLEICQNPADVMLAVDRSGSMADDSKDPPQPLTDVKNAAIAFAKELSSQDRAGLISFATSASNPPDSELVSDFSGLMRKISQINIVQGKIQNTNIGDALLKSSLELNSPRHKPNSGKYIVLLTDGIPTDPVAVGDDKFPEKYALSVADSVKKTGTNVFTIGLGSKVNADLLKKISTLPDQYYAATSSQALKDIYIKIATSICKRGPAVTEIIPRLNPFADTNEVK